MISFYEALQQLAAQLVNNQALQAYAQSKWGKNITARIAYKPRVEIPLNDLPLILIVHPRVGKRRDTGSDIEAAHTVMLYPLFHQPKAKLGVGEQVGFEELIDCAILDDTSLNDLVDETIIRDSANDHGSAHPAYASAYTLEITASVLPVTDSALADFLKMHVDYDLAAPDGDPDATDDIILEGAT